LGCELLASGFNSLDVAKMHGQSLHALLQSPEFANARHGPIGRIGKFFAAALVPFERLHRTTQASQKQLQQRAATLRLQQAALAKANRRLTREVKRRQAGEDAVKKSLEHAHRLFVQSQLMQRQLRHLTRHMLSGQEDERRKLSRNLHDKVAQMLMAINVELSALDRAPSTGARARRARITLSRRLVEKALVAVHQLAHELRPALLDDLGLIPALRIYMEGLAARKRLIIDLTAFAGIEALDSTTRTVLYRVAQGALTNVARHARASRVNMIISEIPGAIRMEVNDGGRPFSSPKAQSSKTSQRLGLLGMRERLEMVGGTLAIESAPGLGTSVRVELPSGAGGAE
jgi:signal transduction histidine kinase